MERSWVKARSLWLAVFAAALAVVAAMSLALPQKAQADEGVWKRLAGEVALDTMTEIVNTGWTKSDTVILVTSEGYWDALTAAGLAGQVNAPVLMTDPNTLSAQTATLLGTLKPTTIIVVGGTAALSDDVAAAAAQATGVTTEVQRVSGDTATGTANEVATQVAFLTKGTWANTAFICTNDGYWDALSAAPISFVKHYPIFLAEGHTSLSGDTIKAMNKVGIKNVYLVGGDAALTSAVAKQVEDEGFTVVDRLKGANAVETSEEVACLAVDKLEMSVDKMGVATTNGYWDALSGAALCGKNNAPVVLVTDEKSTTISSFIADSTSKIYTGYIFGGTAAITEATAKAIAEAAPGGTTYTLTYVIPSEYSDKGYTTPYPVKVKPNTTLAEQGITLPTAVDVGAKENSILWYPTSSRTGDAVNPDTFTPTGDTKVYLKVNPYFTVKVVAKDGTVLQKEYTKTSFEALKKTGSSISAVWNGKMRTAIEFVPVSDLVNDAVQAGAWDKYVAQNPSAKVMFSSGIASYGERTVGQLSGGTYGMDFGDATLAKTAMPAAFGINTSDPLAWGAGTSYATPFAGQTYLAGELAKVAVTESAPQAFWGPMSDEKYAETDAAFVSNCASLTITLTVDVDLSAVASEALAAGEIA